MDSLVSIRCLKCKAECDESNSKHLQGVGAGIRFDVRLCMPCYYSEGQLVEKVSKVELADEILRATHDSVS